MKLTVATGLGILVCAASLHAQETLVGKYSGTFNLTTRTGAHGIAITMEITNAANGKLQGKANRHSAGRAGTGCAGEYKLEGTYQDNKLEITSEAGGPAKDCILHFHLVAEGNKLRGKMGDLDTELSKGR